MNIINVFPKPQYNFLFIKLFLKIDIKEKNN